MLSFNVVWAAGDAPNINISNTGGNNANIPNTGGNNAPTPPSNSSSNQSFTKLQNPLNANSVQEVLLLAADIAIYIGVSFAILAIIFVGFKFVLAQGNSDKLKEAKMWFLWIIVGLAILISSKVIVEIVKNTLIQSGVVNRGAFGPR